MDYLDYTVLGSNHLYMPYHEPEGLFSSFMALGRYTFLSLFFSFSFFFNFFPSKVLSLDYILD